MRSRLLLLTLVVALLAPIAAAQAPGGSAPAWPSPLGERPASGEPVALRVLAGWACTLQGEERLWTTTLDRSRTLTAGFYLELGAGSQVELSWSGSASVRLHGPTGVFVEPAAQPFGGRLIGFRRLGHADFEVRRGALTITLPRGQRLEPGSGLFRLSGHAGGLVDLHHHAGAPIELDIGARYTFPLPAGTRRRVPECLAPLLPTGPRLEPRPTATAPRWRGTAQVVGSRAQR